MWRAISEKEDEENLNQNRPVYSGEKAISLKKLIKL